MLLAVLGAAGALAWMLFLPAFVTAQIRARTGFEVRVTGLSCNAFTGRFAVRGLVLSNPTSFPVSDFVDVREFSAAAEVMSLWADRLVIDELTVDIRKITLVRAADGRSNAEVFQRNLFGPVPATAGASPARAERPPARAFLVRRLRLRFDELALSDHSGAKPVGQVFPLGLDQRYENVTATKQLLVPDVVRRLAAANLSPALGGLVPGDFGRALGDAARATVERSGELLQEAGVRGADLLKGLREKLEESKKP